MSARTARAFRCLLATAVAASMFGTAGLTSGLIAGASAAVILPKAKPDIVRAEKNVATYLDVASNDLVVPDAPFSESVVTKPTHGYVLLDNGDLRYTPDHNYVGPDSLVYAITDGIRTSNATVTITVSAFPQLTNDSITVAPGAAGSVALLANDLSVDGFTTVAIEGFPSHGIADLLGNGVLSFTADAGYHGSDSVEYSVADIDGDTGFGYVDVTIASGASVTANLDDVSGEPDQPLPIDVTANDSVPDGVGAVSVTTAPVHGTTSIVGNQVVYTPDAGFRGADSLDYRVEDVNGDFDSSSVSIDIRHGSGVVAQPDVATTQKDTLVAIPVTVNDDIPDHFNKLEIVDVPAVGATVTVDGNVIDYLPAPGFQGIDSFSYRVYDDDVPTGGDSDVASVEVRVIDGFPVVAHGDTVETSGAIDVDVTANDVTGDGASIVDRDGQTTSIEGGALTVVGTKIRYVPPVGFRGPDSFTYVITDANGDTDFGQVDVFVFGGANPVHVVDDAFTVAPGVTTALGVLGNDGLIDGPAALEIFYSSPDAAVSVVGNHLSYTPDPDVAADVVQYRLTDADGDVGYGMVDITVAVPTPPVPTPPAPPAPTPPVPTPTPPTPTPPVPAIPAGPTPPAPAVSFPLVIVLLSKATAPLKSLVTISGQVLPALGSTATLQRLSGSTWVDVTAVAVAGNGTYSVKVPTSATGASTYAVYATSASSAHHRSVAMTLSVYRASITKVQAAGAEYVVVKNTGNASFSLGDMRFRNKSGKWMPLPRRNVAAGKSISIYTGKGRTTAKQLHLGKKLNLWSKHDIVKLTDAFGTLVAQKKY